ncbi:MAG: Hca operon transcriptional activator HcaR [Frondihabitans sp.]|nr:Hca operon transcriptional activator HcaR [Frondihabitans sp.]
MDLRQMEYFVALAEAQQFTRAAEVTRVSQSGLSAAIRTLEDELQTPLFTRTTRRVELTGAGRALLPHARALLAQAVAGRDAVVAARGEVTGDLRVGSEQCLGVIDLPDLLTRFHGRYPKVTITFEQAGSSGLLSRLRAGDLDIAFVASAEGGLPLGRFPTGAPSVAEIAVEPLVFLCASDSRLARNSQVQWTDLEGETFVDFQESWGVRSINDAAFAERDLDRRIGFSVNDVHTLLDFVQRRLGVALVPRPIAAKPQAQGLVAIPLADPAAPRWSVGVATGGHDLPETPAARLLEMVPTLDSVAVPTPV